MTSAPLYTLNSRPADYLGRITSEDRHNFAVAEYLGRAEYCRRWGLVSDATLAPMTGEQATWARSKADESYWSAQISKVEWADLHSAIDAAQAAGSPRKPIGIKAGLRTELAKRDGGNCWLCHEALGDDCTIEHKQPLARGGTWAFANLALAHGDCNRLMGNAGVKAKDAARKSMRETSHVGN